MKKWISLLLCAALLLPLFGCNKEDDTPEGKLFYYDIAAEPTSLDPQMALDEAARTVLQNLFEGLVRLDENGRATPGVALRWEANNDRTVYTFYLREDAVWSDGTPLTAEDFCFGLARAVDPMTFSPAAAQLFCIQNAQQINEGLLPVSELGVRAVDAHTLEITLAHPYEDFPAQTARPAYMPCSRTFFESTGGQYGMEPEAVLSNGPFSLRKKSGWVHEKYVRLVKSETYCGEGEASPSGVMFSVREDGAGLDRVRSGGADVAAVSYEQALLAQEEGLSAVTFTDTVWGLAFNTQDGVFSNESARRAFILSVDRAPLLENLPENGERTDNLIPPQTGWLGQSYRSAAGDIALPGADGAAAGAALSVALAELGRTKLPAVTVLCPDTPEAKAMVNKLLAMWKGALGYYFNFEALAAEELEKRVEKGDYQLALTRVHAPEDGPKSFLTQLAAVTGFSQADFDAALATVPAQAVENVKALEQRLIDGGVFLPLYNENSFYVTGRTVTGVIVHPFAGGVDFKYAGKTEQAD